MVIVEGLVLRHSKRCLEIVRLEGGMREKANLLRFHRPVAGGLFSTEGPEGSAASVTITKGSNEHESR